VEYENNFVILPDGKTIIGVEGEYKNNLICEDITKNDKSACGKIEDHGYLNKIHTLFYDTIRKSLFVGNSEGRVIKYQQKESPLSWEKTKDYGDLRIGEIYSSEQIGDVLVLGGSNSSIRAINFAEKALLPGRVTTAKESIYSLQACELPGEKVFLGVSGKGQYYLEEETDIYEVTDLAKAFNYDFHISKIQNKKNKKKDKKNKKKVNLHKQIEENTFKETTSTEDSFCRCDSKKIMEVLVTKLEHYFEVFAGTMMKHFSKRFHSRFGRPSIYKNKKLLINRIPK
jgi:hypothetical protein